MLPFGGRDCFGSVPGGNAQAIHDVTQEILLAHGVLVPNFQLWRIAGQLLGSILGAEPAARAHGHGADPVASVAMHLFPALVRPDLAPATTTAARDVLGLETDCFGTARFEGIEIGLPLEVGAGVVTGDATLSSARTGAQLTERLVELGAGLIAHLAGRAWGDAAITSRGETAPRLPT